MENEYYKLIIKNIFQDDAKSEDVYGILEDNVFKELLTNKKIYILEGLEFDETKFLETDASLIGIIKDKSSVSEVALYLRFLSRKEINEKLEIINKMEEEIKEKLHIKKKSY